MRVLGRPRERPGFAAAAEAVLAGDGSAVPEPRLEFLRWLGDNRPVVFHGSQVGGLEELSTERKSRDTTAWGDQTAVYASNDPVWAIYFAVLRRDGGWRGTRNGSIGIAGRRCYFFAHNRGSESPDRFGDGWLYLLPPDSFAAQKRPLGLVDLAHLVSTEPVRPLLALAVTPADFPFRDALTYYREGEHPLLSMLRP